MEKKDDCVFCGITKGTIPCDKVYESDNFVAFLDINPENPGHTLIVPKKHYENVIELPSTLTPELFLCVKKVAEIKLKEKFSGFNLIINTGADAGQVVNHFHLHLIPRIKGDGLRYLTRLKKSIE